MSLTATLCRTDFRRLWLGQAISGVGDQMFLVALAILVLDSGAGAAGLGAVLALRGVSTAACVVVGGVFADRWSRTRIMILADVTRVIAIIAMVAAPGALGLAVVVPMTLVIGAAEAFFQPAYRALLPRVLPSEELEAGNALTAISQRAAYILGPALAGLAIALASPRLALALDAGTFLVSLVTLLMVSEPQRSRAAAAASLVGEAVEGVRAVLARPWLGLTIGMASLQLMLSVSTWIVVLPLVARADLGGTSAYSAILVAFGVGAVVGAVASSRMRPRLPGLVALSALLPFAGLLSALAIPAPLSVLLLLAVVSGAGEEVFGVLWTTGIQRAVPDDVLARVFSLDELGSIALMPLGLGLAGILYSAVGPTALLLFGAVIVVVTTLPLLKVDQVRAFGSASKAAPVASASRRAA
jgi:MFS family permease